MWNGNVFTEGFSAPVMQPFVTVLSLLVITTDMIRCDVSTEGVWYDCGGSGQLGVSSVPDWS